MNRESHHFDKFVRLQPTTLSIEKKGDCFQEPIEWRQHKQCWSGSEWETGHANVQNPVSKSHLWPDSKILQYEVAIETVQTLLSGI